MGTGGSPVTAAIEARGLEMRFGERQVLHGIDLTVGRGEVLCLLGPNGAGKTTTVEILAGFRKRTGGTVSVLGTDPGTAPRNWRDRIGIVMQDCGIDDHLSVLEVMQLHHRYYSAPRPVTEVLELVDLADISSQRVQMLSGGQQRRLDIALALIADPDLIFLDEPTTGLDPKSRRQTWDVFSNLRVLGRTVLLTTHYLDEAQALADRVVVIAGGRIVAEGEPATLGGRDRHTATITFQVEGRGEAVDTLRHRMAERRLLDGDRVTFDTPEPDRVLADMLSWSAATGVQLHGLEVTRPSLEDTYLRLVEQ
jgi:ABC-2 type transport system ATP-binding protein